MSSIADLFLGKKELTSNNLLESVNKIVNDVVTSVMQKNSINAMNIVGFQMKAKGDVVFRNISIDQNIQVMQTSEFNASVKNEISNKIDEKMKQLASVVQEMLSDRGKSTSNNVMKLLSDLNNTIKNELAQINEQRFTNYVDWVGESTDGNAVVEFVTIGQGVNAVMNSIMNTDVVNNIKNDIKKEVDQTADTKNKGLGDLFGNLLPILVIGGIIGGGFLLFGKDIAKPKYLIPVGGAAAIAAWYFFF